MSKNPAPTQMAEVAPAVPMASATSPASYTYRVPAASVQKISAGSQVTIPLGRQTVTGTVLTLHRRPVPYPTKPLTLKNDPPLTPEQLALAEWISATMRGGLGYTLRLFVAPAYAKASTSAKASADTSAGKPASSAKRNQLITLPPPQLVIEKNDQQRYQAIERFTAEAGKNGTQGLILVPELRFIEPLRRHLARRRAAVFAYHSGMALSQQANLWHQVYQGKPVIIVGTQKALFLPYRRLSHAVLEEEYLDTHKLWDQYPRLDNRDVLPRLAALHGSRLLYAGSWPSLARLYDKQQGRLTVVRAKPVNVQPTIVPLSFDDRWRGHLVPPEALAHLQEAVRQKKRSLILHNQRGSWRTAMCTQCHQAVRCLECGSTVFVAGVKGALYIQCRQCDFTGPLPAACPACGSKKIKVFGPGTAKVTDIIRALAPRAAVLEITAGSTPNPQRLERADIIVGTTAIWRYAADLHVDRALWLFPESTLLYPDYRSHERALALLAQLQQLLPARRRVVVVTRFGELVKSSLAAPLEIITQQLLRERERLHYPPYAELVKLTCHARSEKAALEKGGTIRQRIDSHRPSGVTVRGPYQGFNKKDGQHFAAHLLLAGPLSDLVPLYKDLPIARAELSPAQIL